jgi:hypothetical protein
MNILRFITGHEHYWGVPHKRVGDKVLIQTCYECGADRRVKADIQPSTAPEPAFYVASGSSANHIARKAA